MQKMSTAATVTQVEKWKHVKCLAIKNYINFVESNEYATTLLLKILYMKH